MSIDPFTPWHEPSEVLQQRTVGRAEPLQWLARACDRFLAGERPTWCLVTGPRGSGKSHLLQVARGQIADPDAVVWIGEDTATTHDADQLWQRIWEREDPWGWSAPTRRPDPCILFVEGLDRLLAALAPADRWKLRHHLAESGAFLVATALDANLAAGESEPFFGQLDAWMLEPLELHDARTLFVAISEQAVGRSPSASTLTRTEALIRMAGGSPRAIVTLAEAVQGTGGDAVGASDGLLRGVQRLVTHYQQRFHDLAPLGQQILEALARAPRELTASEVQTHTHASSAAVSAAARALEAAGALTRSQDEHDARVSRYALAEPLFRYWLEYRTMPSWDDTRVAWFGRLLGDVLTRDELADVWWGSTTEDVRRAIETHSPEVAESRAWSEYGHAVGPSAHALALQRASRLPLDSASRMVWLMRVALTEGTAAWERLGAWSAEDDSIKAMLDFRDALHRGRGHKAAFVSFLAAMPENLASIRAYWWASEIARVLLDELDPRGRPWALLAGRVRSRLVALPYLRVRFAIEGRRVTDPPVLGWGHLAALSIGPDTLDCDAILAAAHQRRDVDVFRRATEACKAARHPLPRCPRPDLAAPDPDALACLFPLGGRWLLEWAASIAAMSPRAASSALDSLSERMPARAGSGAVSALVALRVRSPERFGTLAGAARQTDILRKVEQAVAQLREREHGRLQPELERVWQAVAPRPDEESG